MKTYDKMNVRINNPEKGNESMMKPINDENSQQNKKICFFALNAYPVITGKFKNHIGVMGGSELQQSLIGKELAKNHYNVSFVVYKNTSNNSYPFECIERIKFFKTINKDFKFSGIFSYWICIKSLWNAMALANADIYYQRGSGSETGVVALFCLFKRRKFIFALSSDMDINGTFFKNARFYEKILIYFGLKTADLILTQNYYQKKILEKKFNRESCVIKNIFSFQSLDPKIKKGSSVLWVGTIRPEWKQPELFLNLAKSIPDANFVMIGGAASNSNFYESIKRDAEKIPNLEFMGFIPYSQINQYFAEASIFVNTSTFEGFPNTFLQAWANFTPVVSLNVDPDELICDRKLGYHSKTFEKMVSDINALLKNDSLRIEMGKNGRKYVEEEHDLNVIIPKYSEILQNLG